NWLFCRSRYKPHITDHFSILYSVVRTKNSDAPLGNAPFVSGFSSGHIFHNTPPVSTIILYSKSRIIAISVIEITDILSDKTYGQNQPYSVLKSIPDFIHAKKTGFSTGLSLLVHMKQLDNGSKTLDIY